jgi:uncharacterized protein YciI
MFIIELIYKAPLTKIDAAMKAHVAFLNRYYASGHFVVSGRKIPRATAASSSRSATIRPRSNASCARIPFAHAGWRTYG